MQKEGQSAASNREAASKEAKPQPDKPESNESDSDREPRSLAVYVHVPFCRQKCLYCDFYSLPIAGQNTQLYVETVLLELAHYLNYFKRLEGKIPRLTSLYIGGGTPTALPKEQLLGLIRGCYEALAATPEIEITVEANPGTVDRELLAALKAQGVNRLSLGVQTMEQCLLKRLGRRHTGEETRQAVESAREAGYKNLSLDLMYGLPGQSMEQWQDTVEKVIAFNPEHLSAYSLKVEPGTPFFQLEQSGKLDLPGEDGEAEMFEWLRERVQRAGYVHYEISNFAKPGFAAQHNLTYWQNQEYLGLGPAAYSGLRGVNPAAVWERLPAGTMPMPLPTPTTAAAAVAPWIRFGNRSDLEVYLHSVRQFKSPVGFTEVIDPALEKAETMFLGLRLLKGVNKAAFKARFGVTIAQAFPGVVEKLRQKGLLWESEECLALSDRAILLANQVFQEFLP